MLDTHRFESGRRRFVHFADRAPPIATALDENDDRSAGLLRAEKNLLETIRDPWKVDSAVILVWSLFAASIAVPWLVKPPLTFEPGWRNLVLVAFGLLATVPAVASFARLLSSWMKLHAFLGRLAGIPGFAALGKIPARLARPLEAQLASRVFDDLDLASVVDILDRLAKALPFLSERRDRCRAYLGSTSRHEAEGKIGHRRGRVVSILVTVSGELHRMKRLDETTRALVHELGAALVALFLPRYIRHFRLFVPQLVIGSLASVFMTSLYFVEPQRLIATVIFLWIVALFIALLTVYISLDRDPVMSAIARTPAHKVSLNWALVQRVIGLALLPAASLLSLQHLQFPIWLSHAIDVVGKALR